MIEEKDSPKMIINIKDLVSTLIDELDKRNILKKPSYSFKEVENKLQNYNYLDTSIILLKEKLKDLTLGKNELKKTLTKTSKVILRDKENIYYYTDETLESDINILKQRIIKLEAEKKHIDACLKELETDEHYDVIKMLYLEEETPQFVQDFYEISQSTFYEWRNKLIRSLAILMRI